MTPDDRTLMNCKSWSRQSDNINAREGSSLLVYGTSFVPMWTYGLDVGKDDDRPPPQKKRMSLLEVEESTSISDMTGIMNKWYRCFQYYAKTRVRGYDCGSCNSDSCSCRRTASSLHLQNSRRALQIAREGRAAWAKTSGVP